MAPQRSIARSVLMGVVGVTNCVIYEGGGGTGTSMTDPYGDGWVSMGNSSAAAAAPNNAGDTMLLQLANWSAGKDGTGEGSTDEGPFNVKTMVKHLFKAGNHLLVPMEVQTNRRMQRILRHFMAEVREAGGVSLAADRGKRLCCMAKALNQFAWREGECQSEEVPLPDTATSQRCNRNLALSEYSYFFGDSFIPRNTQLQAYYDLLKKGGPATAATGQKWAFEVVKNKIEEIAGSHDKLQVLSEVIERLKSESNDNKSDAQTKLDAETKATQFSGIMKAVCDDWFKQTPTPTKAAPKKWCP